MEFLKVEFWNTCNLDVHYQDGFKQILYLDADIVIVDPEITEDGSVNQFNDFNATFKKYDDIFHIETVAPEFLTDAFNAMQQCDNVWVYRKTGEGGRMRNLAMDTEWKECYAKVTLSFAVDYFVMNPCCDVECADCTPVIDSYSFDGADITLVGSDCGGFIQVQELLSGVWTNLGSVFPAGVFSGSGVTVTPSEQPSTLRVHAYDHSCDYGESESITVCSGLVCEIDADNGINQVSIKGTNGEEVVLDWGDGNVDSITMDGNLNAYTNNYTAGSYTLTLTGDVDEVTQLTMQDCDIDSYIGIACFTSLVGWNMSDNNIAALNDNELDNLSSLAAFDFGENSISSIPSGYFDGCTALSQVTIDLNNLTTFPSGLFDNNLNLASIDCSGNSISSVPANLLDNNTLLIAIDLSNNSLVTMPANWLDNNTILRILGLNDNSLTSVPTNWIINNTLLGTGFPLGIEFSNNALSVASVDNLFSNANSYGTNNGIIRTNGGTNGALTGGAGNADNVALIGRGWTTAFN